MNDIDDRLEKLRRLKELKESVSQEPGLIERAGKAGKTVLDNLARGAGNMVSAATSQGLEKQYPELYPEKSPLERFSNWAAQDVKEKLPVDPNESAVGRVVRKGTEAVGGGLVGGFPGLAKAPLSGLATLFAGGVGGDLGGTAGRSFGGEGQRGDILEGVGSILGAIGLAAPTGMLLGPGLSAGEKAINRNSQGLTRKEFDQAEQNLDLFQTTGTKTATLPEAFEGKNSLLGLAETTRASKGGELLANQTASRAEDLQKLGQTFLNRVGPAKDTNSVAVATVQKANQIRKTLEGLRSREFGDMLKNEQLTPAQSFSTYRRMIRAAKDHPDPDFRLALAEVARKFLDEHKQNKPITDVQTLSLRVKRLKENAAGPASSTGTVIAKKDLAKAVEYAEELLGQLSPKFEAANAKYRAATQNIEAQLSGGLGRLTDKNPLTAGEPTVTRLGPLFASGDGRGAAQTIQQLQTPGPVFGPKLEGADPIRAWAAHKLDLGSTDPGAKIRGLEGSSAEQRLAAALTAAGKNPDTTLAPLRAADKLQNFSGLPGTKEPPELAGASALIRPHRTADFLMTDAARTKMHEEIARLMMPTKENLAELQRLARFDPNIRRMLIARGIAVPQVASEE